MPSDDLLFVEVDGIVSPPQLHPDGAWTRALLHPVFPVLPVGALLSAHRRLPCSESDIDMTKRFCLEVSGTYACFSRPEMKVERTSYDVITPSAARAVFEAILWKPGLRWRPLRVEVLKPVRWISVRRNEVGAVASSRNALSAMNEGRGHVAIYIEDERQQRAGLFLRDVSYRLHAEMQFVSDEARANPAKYQAMFERRAAHGQCVNQPYLGCREFAASFRPVPLLNESGDFRAAEDEAPAVQDMTVDLGWMLYDLDFTAPANPIPTFFRASVNRGVMDLASVEVRG